MGDLNIIDQFMETFIRYIDGGFGLLNGDVTALSSTLIALDITLAGLFWALDGEAFVIARLIKKTLYIGSFAFILNNFAGLADIIFKSFSTLGLNATNSGLTADDLLKPGKLAGIGYQAAFPLLQQAGSLMGFTSFFNHAVTILVLLFAWLIVVLAFFILAVQLFITILEFKLTSLAGFVLVPFALWNKTAFLAERVLGNVVASGIKVMVLAVIVGIGATFFADFTAALEGQEPNLAQAMSLVLASIALFGLGIFGPGLAAGLISGAPQLGAGAAIGTVGAITAAGLAAGAGVYGAGRLGLSGGMAALRAGTAMGAGAATAYGLASAASGAEGLAAVGAGVAGVARAGAGALGQGVRGGIGAFGEDLTQSAQAGRQAAWRASGGAAPAGSSTPASPTAESGSAMPAWARRLRTAETIRMHAQTTAQAIREGDRAAHGLAPNLRDEAP
jgi:type IV secretion system protein TrbL